MSDKNPDPEVPSNVNPTLAEVHGTYDWAKVQHKNGLRTARYNKRCGCVVSYMSEFDEIYPELDEDKWAVDWEVERPTLASNKNQFPRVSPKETLGVALIFFKKVKILLDGRDSDLVLPEGLIGQEKVCLEVGLDMITPIPDLTLGQIGLSATLSKGCFSNVTYLGSPCTPFSL